MTRINRVFGRLLLVRLLEGTGGGPRYDGPLHFDAHAYRSESEEGVWEFATGCMRTYKILAARAAGFDADPEVRDIIADRADPGVGALLGKYSTEHAKSLLETTIDVDACAEAGLHYERLDQLLVEHLMGVRS